MSATHQKAVLDALKAEWSDSNPILGIDTLLDNLRVAAPQITKEEMVAVLEQFADEDLISLGGPGVQNSEYPTVYGEYFITGVAPMLVKG